MISDLWDTLIAWDDELGVAFFAHVAEALGATPEETHAVWDEGRSSRSSGPMLDYLRTIGLEGELADSIVERRRELARQAIVPVEGAVETVRELRSRGLKVGLLSVCSDEVPAVWADTAFAGIFDTEVFSCDVGLLKPDPRIYALTCERLGVDPSETLFVGDGFAAAFARASEVAGERGVDIAGGASTVRQALEAGVVDELVLDIVPVLLGSGERLFDGVGDLRLEPVEVIHSPLATHVRYRVSR